MTGWLQVGRGDAPLIVVFPHTGIDLVGLDDQFRSPWLARLDTDWWVDRLYDFVADMGATTVRTLVSRSIIDANRDPAGASLYPGRATTGLCPETTFDGVELYAGSPPVHTEIARRRRLWFDPYHQAIGHELDRLRAIHAQVVLYDAHSIRSVVPRLFEGTLPQFNIGTHGGIACHPDLTSRVVEACAASELGHVIDGRFRGGWTTRHHGRPANGIHAIQMELAIRGYCSEPAELTEDTWPPRFEPAKASPLQATLAAVLGACLDFAQHSQPGTIR